MSDTAGRPAAPGAPGSAPPNPIEDRLLAAAAPPLPADPPEHYDVDIPIAPELLLRMGITAQRHGVEAGGVYDDKIVAVAVYDRPWTVPGAPGAARLLGTIYVSTRTDRVYRIELDPATGATFDDLLAHLERLTGLAPGPDPTS